MLTRSGPFLRQKRVQEAINRGYDAEVAAAASRRQINARCFRAQYEAAFAYDKACQMAKQITAKDA